MGWTLTEFDEQDAGRVMRGYSLWLRKESGISVRQEAEAKAAAARKR